MDKPKLLLVDDESASLSLYSMILKDSGAELISYIAPEPALEYAKENECALLLVDIQMPVMDGFTLVDKIKNTERNRYTPVIFLTAFYQDTKSVNKGYKHGAVDFLFKPVNSNMLRGKVNVFMDLFYQKKALADKTDRLQSELEEHKITQNRLLNKEKQLEMAQELTRIGNWRWDLGQNKFLWDFNMFKLHGISQDATAPQPEEYLSLFVHPDDLDLVKGFYQNKEKRLQSGSYKFEYRIINSHGEVIYLQAISQIVYDETRNYVKALMGTIQDVTVQKETEFELMQNKEQMEIALAAIGSVVYEYDIDSGMFSFSEEIYNVLPLSSPQVSFQQIARHFAIEQWQNLKTSFEYCIDGNSNYCESEFSIAYPQGKKYFVNRGKVIRNSDKATGSKILGAFINVTSLRVAQQQLSKINADLENRIQQEVKKRQKQQALLFQKSKLESLGELAAGIGHEINNPLSIINLSVENALANVNNGRDYDFIKKKLININSNVDKIAGIIDEIKVFSRDKKPEKKVKININNIIKSVTALITVQYSNKNISLEKKLDQNISHISGFTGKFEQVLFNLLSNSRYAVEKKQASTKDPDYKKRIVISTYEDNDYVYMEFWDNGLGIAKENRNKVFDPFFTNKEIDIGTGLGLSVAYGIIKDFGGEINLTSDPGLYTSFLISLPKYAIKEIKSN